MEQSPYPFYQQLGRQTQWTTTSTVIYSYVHNMYIINVELSSGLWDYYLFPIQCNHNWSGQMVLIRLMMMISQVAQQQQRAEINGQRKLVSTTRFSSAIIILLKINNVTYSTADHGRDTTDRPTPERTCSSGYDVSFHFVPDLVLSSLLLLNRSHPGHPMEDGWVDCVGDGRLGPRERRRVQGWFLGRHFPCYFPI